MSLTNGYSFLSEMDKDSAGTKQSWVRLTFGTWKGESRPKPYIYLLGLNMKIIVNQSAKQIERNTVRTALSGIESDTEAKAST